MVGSEFTSSMYLTVALFFIFSATAIGWLVVKFISRWEIRSVEQAALEKDRMALEFERLKLQKENDFGRSSVNIDNSGRDNEERDLDNGGFVYIEMDEDKKAIFIDALMGFEEFARGQGYNVKLYINSTITNKVGVKIVIIDIGVTVSRSKVQEDASKFVKKILAGEDFSDFPMVNDPTTNQNIAMALNTRSALLKQRAEISAESAAAYRELLSEMRQVTKAAISYGRPENSPYIQIEARGGSMSRDNFNAEHSPGATQGRHNTVSGNTINVGSTITERVDRIKGIEDLILNVGESSLPQDKKSDIKRYLLNAKDELNVSGAPNKDMLAKWLSKTKNVIDISEGGEKLLEGAKKLFELFGDSSSWSDPSTWV